MLTSNASDYDDDEYDIVAERENQDSDLINKNDDIGSENEENVARRIDPSTSKRHVVRNPLPKLNTERLKGPKGIQTIEKYFEGFKFRGKGYEKLDLDRIMKRMEHWAHRLFPKLDFDDFLETSEKLGTKKDLQVFIRKYRDDMITADDDVINQNKDEEEEKVQEDEPIDEFDLLIAEQIEKQKQVIQQSSISNKSITNDDAFNKLLSQPNIKNSQSTNVNFSSSQLSDEVKERIEKNRQQAIQRRLARLIEIEEAKRKKLEDTESTQFENNSCSTQIFHSTQILEKKECENDSQMINKDHEIEIEKL